MKKKFVAILTAGIITATCAVTGTLAWLSAESTLVNTFTVGKIQMILDEKVIGTTNDARTEDGQTYKIMPGSVITKDPQVTIVENSEDCYVFAYVENGLEATVSGATTLDVDMNSWRRLPSKTIGAVYQYIGEHATDGDYVVKGSTTDQALEKIFNTVTINGDVVDSEKLGKLQDKTITVKAYAHQVANCTAEDAKTAAIEYFTNLETTP